MHLLHVQEALKWPTHETIWMPVWNLETELIPAGRAIFNLSEHDVKAKVEKWGPIPRHALQKTNAENEEELTAAISRCSLSALQSCIAYPETAPKDLSHTLICISVGPDYRRGRIHFATDYVESKVIKKFEDLSDVAVKEFLASSSGDPAVNRFRGKLLESMRGNAHKVLQRGGVFNGFNLQDDVEEDILLNWAEFSRLQSTEHTARGCVWKRHTESGRHPRSCEARLAVSNHSIRGAQH